VLGEAAGDAAHGLSLPRVAMRGRAGALKAVLHPCYRTVRL
jgi:hypothetical protein